MFTYGYLSFHIKPLIFFLIMYCMFYFYFYTILYNNVRINNADS